MLRASGTSSAPASHPRVDWPSPDRHLLAARGDLVVGVGEDMVRPVPTVDGVRVARRVARDGDPVVARAALDLVVAQVPVDEVAAPVADQMVTPLVAVEMVTP